MIETKNLSAGYGGTPVIRGISAAFAPGEVVGVIGPNGAGKSTLLKAVRGMIPALGGAVCLDGESIAGMSRGELARRAAYLPQTRRCPDMTVEQTVLHGRFPHLRYPHTYRDTDRDMARAAMEKMDILALAGRPMSTLSGGMRQKVYIAMVLAQDTPYILFDEPTVHLDITYQLALMRMMRTLAREGRGIIAVMHDLPMAMTFSDRILVMREGEAVCMGRPEEICRGDVIPRVFGVTVDRFPDGKNYHCRME
ncbi:MAG: ABC transporter ATP-binding protein [Ruminococcaceae bacterium]|nr:ABC transporter ATP-binding protein [Oscillospiraceae bacterium]